MRAQVDYSDGDKEVLWLPLERVRLCMHAGEELQAPTSVSLHAWADKLAASAASAAKGVNLQLCTLSSRRSPLPQPLESGQPSCAALRAVLRKALFTMRQLCWQGAWLRSWQL